MAFFLLFLIPSNISIIYITSVIIFQRLSPIGAAMAAAAACVAVYFYPTNLVVITLLVLLALWFIVSLLPSSNLWERLWRWLALVFPLVVGGFLWLLIDRSWLWIWLPILIIISIFWTMEILFYLAYSRENISRPWLILLNIILAWWLVAVMALSRVLLLWPGWLIAILSGVGSIWLLAHAQWINNQKADPWWVLLCWGLIYGQIFWVISLLPITFTMQSIVGLVFYVVGMRLRLYQRLGQFSKNSWHWIIAGLLIVLVLLLVSRWQ